MNIQQNSTKINGKNLKKKTRNNRIMKKYFILLMFFIINIVGSLSNNVTTVKQTDQTVSNTNSSSSASSVMTTTPSTPSLSSSTIQINKDQMVNGTIVIKLELGSKSSPREDLRIIILPIVTMPMSVPPAPQMSVPPQQMPVNFYNTFEYYPRSFPSNTNTNNKKIPSIDNNYYYKRTNVRVPSQSLSPPLSTRPTPRTNRYCVRYPGLNRLFCSSANPKG